VRQQLIGDPVRVSGHVIYRAVVDDRDFPADLKWNAPCVWAGPNCHLVHYPLRGGEQWNVVVTFHSRTREEWGVTDGSREEVMSYFDGIAARPRQLLALPRSWRRWATADRDPVTRWTFGRVTLLGDAAHPMYPIGSNGASQAILDARVLTREILAHGPTNAALVAYEAERRPATTDLVMLNRRNGPEQVMQLVEERAPDGFGVVTDVLSQQELEDIAANYKRVAGFQVEALNAKPPIVTMPGRASNAG
jgi:2-polyprenyl-6-methoxyphenol hydroxylase-like FAD-dependent oxidoreductase